MQQIHIRSFLCAIPAFLLVFAVSGTRIDAQVLNGSTSSKPTYTGTPITATSGIDMDETPFTRTMLHQRAEARKLERHRRIVDSANRLVELTQQFQADVHGRPLTPDDDKRLDEIAKLARVVKEQMAGN